MMKFVRAFALCTLFVLLLVVAGFVGYPVMAIGVLCLGASKAKRARDVTKDVSFSLLIARTAKIVVPSYVVIVALLLLMQQLEPMVLQLYALLQTGSPSALPGNTFIWSAIQFNPLAIWPEIDASTHLIAGSVSLPMCLGIYCGIYIDEKQESSRSLGVLGRLVLLAVFALFGTVVFLLTLIIMFVGATSISPAINHFLMLFAVIPAAVCSNFMFDLAARIFSSREGGNRAPHTAAI